MGQIIAYKKAKNDIAAFLKAKDIREAEAVLSQCADETRVRLYREMSPQELGLLTSRGDTGWVICELPRGELLRALAHDPELIDEKGQLFPIQAVAVAFSLADRNDASVLYHDEGLMRNIVNLAFLVELPVEIPLDDGDEIEEWLSGHWLSNFEPEVEDLLRYDEETLTMITQEIREQAREELRMIQRAIKERAKKIEKEMFDI
ncbi:MAG: hypothetical protein JXD19_12040 [Deltaproteobacteria bacterium]|nr:hypothetical protein [Deltaproteobacteria bacterium]